MRFCNLPCPLEVPLRFLAPAEEKENIGDSANLTLVPETLHLAQESGVLCPQPNDRERMVFAAC